MTTDNEWLQTRKTIDTWLHRVFYDDRLNGRDKTTATALSWYYHQDRSSNRFGTAWPSQDTLAQRTGQSVGQVDKALSTLTKHKYLRRVGKTGMTGTVIRKFILPHTDEDLSWLDDLKRPTEADATDPEGPEADSPSTENPDTGKSTDSNTSKNRSSNTLETTHNSLEGNSVELYSLISPSSALLADSGTPPDGFLEIERDHREEFINYWFAASLNPDTSYWFVLRSFLRGFSDEHRIDWVATFKHFMSHINDDRFQGSAMDDARDHFLSFANEDEAHRGGYTDEGLEALWAGITTNVRDIEYQRAWDHLLLHHSGETILKAAASPLVHKKYPRELVQMLQPPTT